MSDDDREMITVDMEKEPEHQHYRWLQEIKESFAYGVPMPEVLRRVGMDPDSVFNSAVERASQLEEQMPFDDRTKRVAALGSAWVEGVIVGLMLADKQGLVLDDDTQHRGRNRAERRRNRHG